jgi:hypothetical protein
MAAKFYNSLDTNFSYWLFQSSLKSIRAVLVLQPQVFLLFMKFDAPVNFFFSLHMNNNKINSMFWSWDNFKDKSWNYQECFKNKILPEELCCNLRTFHLVYLSVDNKKKVFCNWQICTLILSKFSCFFILQLSPRWNKNS